MLSWNVTVLALLRARRRTGRLAPGERLTVSELMRGTTLVTGAASACSVACSRFASSRISSGVSGESRAAAS